MRPVEQTTTSPGRDAEHLGHVLGGAVRVEEALCAGAGVGPAGVEHHGVDAAVGDHLARPRDGSGLDAVAREDRRGVVVGAVVDDEREVGGATRLEAGGDARAPEARGRWTVGAPLTGPLPRSAGRGSPRDPARGWRTARRRRPCPWSGCRRPRRRRRGAAARRRQPGAGRGCCRCTEAVAGHGPRAARGRTARRHRPSPRPRGRLPGRCRGAAEPCRSRGCPRGIGASVGVNDTVTGSPAARDRFCSISGVWRCPPPTPYGDMEPMTSLPSRWGFRDLPAPDVPDAATTTTSSASSRPAAKPGARASEMPVG